MSAPSLTADERARKAFSAVLQVLKTPGKQGELAGLMGVSDSTVSRTKDDIEPVIRLLAFLGFKVVPVGMKCYPAQQIDAIFLLAQAHMAQAKSADEMLRFDE